MRRRSWAFVCLGGLLLLAAFGVRWCEGISSANLTLAWDHDPGPFSYNVYESTNLLSGWVLKTNVTDLRIQIARLSDAHFFTVTCVDTNTGYESVFATK